MTSALRVARLAMLAALLTACGEPGAGEPATDELGPDAGGLVGEDASPGPGDAAVGPADGDAAADQDGGPLAPGADSGSLEPDTGIPEAGQGDSATSAQPDANGPVEPRPCTLRYFADDDRDGFGNPARGSCERVTGYVANAADCYDANAEARPDQLGHFAEHRGDGSYDYDCNGTQELIFPRFAECPQLDDSCPPPNRWPAGFSCDYVGMMDAVADLREGWTGYQALPGCGQRGLWGVSITWDTVYDCRHPSNGLRRDQLCR